MNWQGWYKRITRALCPFCVVLSGLIVCDALMPATETDEATVTGKHMQRAHGHLRASGRHEYNEAVPRSTYELARTGDTLRLSLSRFFSEWKTLEVIRDGQVIATAAGTDLYPMAFMGLLFILSACAFFPDRLLFSNIGVVVMLPIVNLVGIALWIKLICVWTGHADKM